MFGCSVHPSVSPSAPSWKLVLRHGADLEAPGPDGLSPLLLACRCDAARVVQLLLEKGAVTTGVRRLDDGCAVTIGGEVHQPIGTTMMGEPGGF